MIDLQRLKQSIDAAADAAVQKHQAELQQSLQDALANSVASLKKSILKQVLEQLEPELATPPGGAPTDLANAAVASIQDASTQTDILGALLGGAEKFSERSGLLVVKGNVASGWQCRGLDADAFKQIKLDAAKGLIERAIRTRGPVAGAIAEFDSSFAEQFGAPADGNVILLPLVVRDRVAALLYADGGTQGSTGLDASGVEVLVRATDLWLEVISLRKLAEHHGLDEKPQEEAAAAVPQAATAAASAPTVREPIAAQVPAPEPVAAPVPVVAAAVAEAAPEDELHKKAKRFAKLLVDEIKLYNKKELDAAKAASNIYEALREPIEKSREMYKKRYAETVTDVDYFSAELVRLLADNDVTKMGASFRA